MSFDTSEERAQAKAVDVSPHRWEFCVLCAAFMVVCAKCGNNCCSGGTNNCPDNCDDAYAKQNAALEVIAKLVEDAS